MRKSFFLFLAAVSVLAFVSCDKEENVVTPIGEDTTPVVPPATEPAYQEGIYAPLMKIAAITQDDGVVQTWTWNGDQLASVVAADGNNRQFTYADGRLASVSGTINNLMGILSGVSGTMSFTYNGDQLKDCTTNSDGTDVALMLFNHADNRISRVDVAVDADYISNMLNGMFLQGKGKPVDPKQITLSASDCSVHCDLAWTGKNVTGMVSSGAIPFALSKEAYEAMRPYLPIDSSMLSLIDMYFMVANALPMQLGIADTMEYTYDSKINPYYCYLGEVTPSNLSLNNVLSSVNHGNLVVSVALGTNPTPVYSQPIDERATYFYEYNERNYPTKVEGKENYTITYKE